MPPAKLDDFSEMFGNIVSSALGLAGILLFLYLLSGGLKYITSGGDPKATEAAKKTITYAIMGLVLAVSAVLIMDIIEEVTGQSGWTDFQIFRGP